MSHVKVLMMFQLQSTSFGTHGTYQCQMLIILEPPGKTTPLKEPPEEKSGPGRAAQDVRKYATQLLVELETAGADSIFFNASKRDAQLRSLTRQLNPPLCMHVVVFLSNNHIDAKGSCTVRDCGAVMCKPVIVCCGAIWICSASEPQHSDSSNVVTHAAMQHAQSSFFFRAAFAPHHSHCQGSLRGCGEGLHRRASVVGARAAVKHTTHHIIMNHVHMVGSGRRADVKRCGHDARLSSLPISSAHGRSSHAIA
jgi:hypothetical protein